MAIDVSSIWVRGASTSDSEANWVTLAVELVFVSAVNSSTPASRTSSTALDELTEPDASRTRLSSRPQDCSIEGLGPGGTAASAGGVDSVTGTRRAAPRAPTSAAGPSRLRTTTTLPTEVGGILTCYG